MSESDEAIVRLILSDRLAEAEAATRARLERNAADAQAQMLAGRVAGARRDHAGALAAFERAVTIAPDNGGYLAALARCHARGQDMARALALVERARGCARLDEVALDEMAAVLAQVGRHAQAAELLRQAVGGGTRNAAVFFNLGNNLKFTGDFDGARSAFAHAVSLAPGFAKAHAALSSLGGTLEGGLARIEAALAVTHDPRAAIHLRHAAARECEALGRFDDAWTHLQQGKAALQAATGNDPRAALPHIERLRARIPSLAAPAEAAADGPILILGMPRSGTTVLDRILSNHPQVASIGESLYFAQLLKIACGSTSRGLLDEAVLAALDDGRDLSAIGADYVARGHLTQRESPRFLDKFHLNVLLAGHMMRAMPTARMLCIVRAPLDTIVGNYRQLFEYESTIYSYGLDVDAVADFYIAFRRLAEAWAAWAPHRFRIVGYEELVADPDRVARPLVEFCGLDWRAGLTAIERNTASVSTASALQVRRGIHGGSIGSWRRYESWLEGVRTRLRAAALPAD